MRVTLEELRRRFADIDAADLDRWIENRWVRPDEVSGTFLFQEIDIARVHLIAELRDDLAVAEDVVPLVLSLLDQLYGVRRQMRLMCEVIAGQPEEVRRAILAEVVRQESEDTGPENPET